MFTKTLVMRANVSKFFWPIRVLVSVPLSLGLL